MDDKRREAVVRLRDEGYLPDEIGRLVGVTASELVDVLGARAFAPRITADPRMSMDRATISFAGGPADGNELNGLAGRVVGDWGPAYVCANIDGRHEHYVRVAEGRYQHAGTCRRLAEGGRHPDCGHNHETTEHIRFDSHETWGFE